MKVEKNIVVERPIEKVFAFLTDVHKVKLWLPIESIRQTSSGPLGVGSTFTQETQFMGQRFETTSEVTRYEPPHVFVLKMVQGPFSLTNSMYCEPTDTGGTSLTIVGEADPGPAMTLLGPLVAQFVTRQMDTQVNLLKHVLETQA